MVAGSDQKYNWFTMTKHEFIEVLEDINGKLDVILEGQKAWASVPRDVEEMSVMVKEIDTDLKDIITTLGCDPQKGKQES